MEARRRAHLESCCTATELKQSRKQLRFVEYGNIANVKIKGQILATTVQGSEFQFGRITNPTELRFSGEHIYHATLELKRGNWIIETASLENVRTQLDTYHNMKGCVWLSSQQIFAFHDDLNVQEVSYKRVDMPFL